MTYLVHWNAGANSGVFWKIVDQTRAWCELGLKIALVVESRHDTEHEWQHALDSRVELRFLRYSSTVGRVSRLTRLAASKAIPFGSIVVMRQDTVVPGHFLLAARTHLFVEINTDLALEKLLLRNRWLSTAMKFAESRLLISAAGFFAVTEELANRYRRRLTDPSSVVIPNGIDLERVPRLAARPSGAAKVFFAGTLRQPWQGIDRLVNLASHLPDVAFVLIGDVELGSPPPHNIHLMAPVRQDELRAIATTCIAGIGPLSLDRAGISTSSALKHREYIAMGLPLIMSADDPDVPEGVDWALRLSDDVRSDAARIRAFLDRWSSNRLPESAGSSINSLTREKMRLRFIEDSVRRRLERRAPK